MSPERKLELQRVYCRLAHDAHYKADAVTLAKLTAVVLNDAAAPRPTPPARPIVSTTKPFGSSSYIHTATISAIDIWIELGLTDMMAIADGTHPCLLNPHYLPKPYIKTNNHGV